MKKKLVAIFFKYAVKKPVIFIAVIMIGCAIFVGLAVNIKIPLYSSYVCVINKTENGYEIHSKDRNLSPDGKIFVYTNRNEKVFCVDDYLVVDNTIIISESELPVGECSEIQIDIEREKITLLKYLFLQGN